MKSPGLAEWKGKALSVQVELGVAKEGWSKFRQRIIFHRFATARYWQSCPKGDCGR